MKVAVACNSLLLESSLKLFLKDYLSTYKRCDLIVTDHKIDVKKPIVIVNSSGDADIQIPFSKSSLIIKLEEIYKKNCKKLPDINSFYQKGDKMAELEKRIDELTDIFKKSVMSAIKEYYEK